MKRSARNTVNRISYEMFENYVDEDTAKTAMEKYINNAFDGG